MGSEQKHASSQTARLVAVSLVILLVVALAFLLVIRSFDRIGVFMEEDVEKNVRIIKNNSEVGRSLASLELDVHVLEASFLRNPELLEIKSRQIAGNFASIRTQLLDEIFLGDKQSTVMLDNYQRALGNLLKDFKGINGNLIQLDKISDDFVLHLGEIEKNTGDLMVDYALAGKNTQGLQQIYALVPFCQEQVSKAAVLLEAGIANNKPELLGVDDQYEFDTEKTVAAAIFRLTQTLRTLTSSNELIAGHARTLLNISPRYMDIVRELNNGLRTLTEDYKIFDKSWYEIKESLSRIDFQTTKAIDAIKEDTGKHLGDTTNIIYMVSAVVFVVTLIGWLIIRKIAMQMERTQYALRQSHDEMEVRVHERTEDLLMINERLKREVVERKKSERALKEAHERLVTILDSIEALVYVADMESYELLFVNKYGRDVWGDIAGQTCWKALQSGQEQPCEFCTNKYLLDPEGRPTGTYTWEFQNTVDGQWYFINDRAIRWLDGRIVRLEIASDITKRKKAEQERERLTTEIENKNKEMEQLVYVTSHDLRTPLAIVQGYVKELEITMNQIVAEIDQEKISPGMKKRLAPYINDIQDTGKYIRSNIHKMDALLYGLLKLSRSGNIELNMEQLDMNGLAADVKGSLAFKIKETGSRVEISDLPACIGDETQVNQVFSNLLGNALKYLDPDRPGIIRITGHREGSESFYCVEDNGIGMAPSEQGNIFNIFYQGNSAAMGEGLGLSIVSKIIERHGGRIRVESEQGKGSRFYVVLPGEGVKSGMGGKGEKGEKRSKQ
jgi:signal transduction histidine kinase